MGQDFDQAVEKLRERLRDSEIGGSFKFDIAGAGVILVRDGTLSTEDGDADVTVRADLETFRKMFEGELSPAAAFMTGKVEVDGDMGQAMKLSALIG